MSNMRLIVSIISPSVEYFDAKKDPDNYVRVNVDIKGLKKKFLGGPSNADIKFDVQERYNTFSHF